MEVVTDNVQAVVALRYPLERVPDEWEIPEVPVPESVSHEALVTYLRALLAAWAARSDHEVAVARNLAVRWVKERPRVGIDPDVAILDPKPPGFESMQSLKLWAPGCRVPALAIEVVSSNHPYKYYAVLPERYAAMGIAELWVLDPGGYGPRRLGGPHLIQQWTREDDGTLVRSHAGEGPVYSAAVEAWIRPDPETGIAVARDVAGKERWLTAEEDHAAHRDEAERRTAELEARLRKLGVEPG